MLVKLKQILNRPCRKAV